MMNVEEPPKTSAIQDGFYLIMAEFPINKNHEAFIVKLAEKLPLNAFPHMDTQDGSEIDIYGEDRLIIAVGVDYVCVSDFSSGEQDFKSFDAFGDKAVEHIVDCYHRVKLTSDDFK